MSPQEIYDILKAQFSDSILELKSDAADPADSWRGSISIAAPAIKDVAKFLRDDQRMQFEFLSSLSGVDLKEIAQSPSEAGAQRKLMVAYHLASMTLRHRITLKVEVPVEKPEVPSVESVWRSADWHEREAYDLVGVVFTGHPDLRRILLPYDWEGHPLRKDYQVPEYYNGMKVPY